MSVKIITDSAADLTAEYSKAHDITVIPLTTAFGETEYLEGVTISHREFYEKLIEDDELPRTSQIPPYRFEAAYRSVLDAVPSGTNISSADAAGKTANEAVVITLSSKLSGTYQSAALAAQDFAGRIFPVDSLNATVGEQVLVKRAAELAEKGMCAQKISETLQKERGRIRLVALLDTLEYLKRGGRISPTAAFFGDILSIKPVVTVIDGEVHVIGKARGSKRGNNMLMEEIEKCGGVDFSYPIALGYTGLSDGLLQKYIADSAQIWSGHIDSLPICTVGSTIGTHVGPGAIAVAFFQRSDG